MASKSNRILIVDDRPENLHCLSNLLIPHGYEVQRTTSGQLALNAAIASPPDLILLDIMIPDMNGYEVFERLRKNEKTKEIPVIFISVLEDTSEKVKAFNLGCCDYITKPFKAEEVLARIEHQIKLQTLQKQLKEQNAQLQHEIRERVLAEAALQESESKYRHLVETSQDMIWSCDVRGNFTFVNSAVKQILGYEPEEMIGRPFADFLAPEQIAKEQSVFQHLLAGESVCQYETTHIAKDGRRIYLLLNAIALLNPEGQVSGATGTASNISDRKHREEALRLIVEGTASTTGNEFFRSCVRYLTEVLQLRYAIISEWLDPTKTIGRTLAFWAGVTWGENFEYTTADYPCGNVLGGSRCFYPEQVQVLFPNNQNLARLDAQSYLGIPLIDSKGNVLGCLAVLDTKPMVSDAYKESILKIFAARTSAELERKQAEEKLAKSEALLIEAQKVAHVGCWEWDVLTQEITWSEELFRIFGLDPQQREPTYTEFFQQIHPDDRTRVKRVVNQTLASGNSYKFDFRIVRPDGQVRHVEARGEVLVREQGRVRKLFGTTLDITERKQAQALLAGQNHILAEIASDVPLSEILDALVRLVESQSGQMRCSFLLLDKENRLRLGAAPSLPDAYNQAIDGIAIGPNVGSCGTAAYYKATVIVEDIANDPRWADYRDLALSYGLKACWSVPILSREGTVLGTFAGYYTKPQNAAELDQDLIAQTLYLAKIAIERQRSQQALCQSKERLQLALDGSDLGLWDRNILTGEIYLDPQWKRMLGYQIDEIENNYQAWMQLIHPEDLPEAMTLLNLYLEGLFPVYDVEYRMLSKSGHWQWILAHGKVCERDETGKPLRIAGTHKDISDKKAAELALQKSNIILRSIIDSTPDIVFVKDDLGRYVVANSTVVRWFGKPLEEILGKDDTAFFPPEIARQIMEVDRTIMRAGKSLTYEELTADENGMMRTLLTTKCPWRDVEGNIIGVVGIARDISDRKQIEEALWQGARRERAISQVIQRMRETLEIDTIFTATTSELRNVLNCDRVVVYRFNPDWSGEFVAESVAKGWTPLLPEQRDNPTFPEKLLEDPSCAVKTLRGYPALVSDTYMQETKGGVYTQGVNYQVTENIYNTGFTPCYINLLEKFQARAYIIAPIFCGSQLWGLLASYQNSDSRSWSEAEINIVVQIGNQLGVALQQAKLLEETQRQSAALQEAVHAADTANRAKSQFLANMSHELRTPLNAILGFTQVMNRDKSLGAEHQQQLGIINRAGEHLLDLINDILEMSKIEAGRTTLNESGFDLTGLFNSLKEMLQFKAESKGLQLIFDCASDLPKFVKTDASKLRQILINILGNAIKFTEEGSVTLRVSTVRVQGSVVDGKKQQTTPNGQRTLHFEIEDTGPGIAPEEIDKIFETFGQTETGRKLEQGTGLGLPISRQFVQLLGGDIRVTSTLGIGSLFAFDIKVSLAEAADIQTTASENKVIGLAADQPEYRILVVDDVRASRLVLVKLLTSIGFSVREATNGQEAVALWSSWFPHLIFMDMRMPVMNGYEATKQIKSHLKGQATVIIALTSSAFEEQRMTILSVGCDDFVRKPFKADILFEKIAAHLGVLYLYEEKASSIEQELQKTQKLLLKADLKPYFSHMPAEWVEQLCNAASLCSDDMILDLIKQIPEESSLLAKVLSGLVYNFEFEEIIQLTRANASKKVEINNKF